MPPLNVAVIGCGVISGAYLRNAGRFDSFLIRGVADTVTERAREAADAFGVAAFDRVEDAFDDDLVDVALILTPPDTHASITAAALRAGKHVYVEKPLATTTADGRELVALARQVGRVIASAPDTILAPPQILAREMVGRGAIGTPIGAAAFTFCRGHERWHPRAEFFYRPGGGPVFDMGPYYVGALVALLGSVRSVFATGRTTWPRRRAYSEGTTTPIDVQVPTHVHALLEFACGVTASTIYTFDVEPHSLPYVEVYGTEGTISLPNPNKFDGRLRIRGAADESWREMSGPEMPSDSRGLGLDEMCGAIAAGRTPLLSAERALHLIEVLCAHEESVRRGQRVAIETPLLD